MKQREYKDHAQVSTSLRKNRRDLCLNSPQGWRKSLGEPSPTADAGQKIGTLIDLASDTNYITHGAARRLNLRNEKITLVVYGDGGMAKAKVKTQRYLLKVRVKTPTGMEKAHELVCYGLDEIA